MPTPSGKISEDRSGGREHLRGAPQAPIALAKRGRGRFFLVLMALLALLAVVYWFFLRR